MQQLQCRHEHEIKTCSNAHPALKFITPTLLYFATLLGTAAIADTAAVATSANVTDPGSALARQATVTTAGTSTVHSYLSAFETTLNALANKTPTTPDRQIAEYNPVLWIFDVALDLHSDYDHDGHYSTFNLTLDLDTNLSASTVYAALYLATDGGPWNEYAVTSNFTVRGRGSEDTFSLQAELDSGYPRGYYNHHIEIYDAYSHELIGSYGPADSHQFHGLPMESRIHEDQFSIGTDITLSFSGTGSMDIELLALCVIVTLRCRRKSATRGREHDTA